jgi:mannose-6-phosphate isomerase-like protein (cupin superfamily)
VSEKPTAEGIQYFKVDPPVLASGKQGTVTVRTDITWVEIQAIAAGSGTNLHAHTGVDGVWYVVSGRGKFYTTGDQLVGEIGSGEGFLIKRNTPYWFECTSGENLVLLHTATKAQTEVNKRINYEDSISNRSDFRPDARPEPVVAQSS